MRLKHAEELHLERQRHLADLVEEERSSLSLRDASGLGGVCARKGAAGVPEQLALEQVLGNRTAVNRDEGRVGALARAVHRPRDKLFAVPLSPVTSTVQSVSATRSTTRKRSTKGSEFPMTPCMLRGCADGSAVSGETSVDRLDFVDDRAFGLEHAGCALIVELAEAGVVVAEVVVALVIV